jgi:histone acetyltransferase (RNA polymerase elongator complex component)
MLYVGVETGNDILLKKVTKGARSKGIIESCQKAKRHGYVLSCMIILGLGGKTYTNEHIRDTARVVSEIAPDYLGALTLYLEDEIYNEFMTKFDEPFTPLDDIAVLEELEMLISNFNSVMPVIFRANHASNIYSFGGILPNDKHKLFSLIRELKLHPEMLKPKVLRRF